MRIAVANAAICASMGGSERAAIRLAREMRDRGHDVRIMTVQTSYPPFYKLDPRIPVHFFPGEFMQGNPEAVVQGPATLVEQQVDVLVSLESDWKHALWGIMADKTGIPHVVSERITPWLIENEFWNKSARREFLSTRAAVHELLPGYLQFIPKGVPSFVIPNVAPADLPDACPKRNGSQHVLLYLGRFSQEKRPKLLLQAFAQLAKQYPDWTLRFAGWGEKEKELLVLRKNLRLENRVEIRHAHPDVNLEYQAASIYCLPTLHEGFPNTVLEAMGNGLPVVGIADCIAMRSIITPGQNGLLAAHPTPESLAKSLDALMSSKENRQRMGQNAWEDVKANYSPSLFDKWEAELLKLVTNCKKQNRIPREEVLD